MNRFFFFLVVASALSFTTPPAKQLRGAWQSQANDTTQVVLFSDGYFSWTSYKTTSGEFIQTKGGSFTLSGNDLSLLYEFHTADGNKVGTTETWKLGVKDELLQLTAQSAPTFKGKTLDAVTQTVLTGAWLMGGRKQDGNITRRDTTTPRKTMKILTGNRFQWIAYNTETKQFSGTGGGTYTTTDSTYTETIEFFSRDATRVGMKLQFNYDVQGTDWHHSGKSSAGEPMYEIWVKRD
jgi:hypothetical protein